jgi:Domain of unknown function (DUF1876)
MTTMADTTSWTIELRFDEDEDRTVATAVLRLPSGREVTGHGRSRRNPHDRPAPRIGEEIAGARALSNLANELLEVAATEIERNVHGEQT